MSKTNYNTKKQYKQLSLIERTKIETLLNEKKPIRYIAEQLGRNISTIYREIKRGSVNQIVNRNGIQRDELKYYAETSHYIYKAKQQNKYHNNLTEKFSQQFFKDLQQVVTEKYRTHSIDTFVHWYRQNHPNEKVPCTKTVYTFVHQGIIPIKPIDLPKMVSIRKRPKKDNTKTYKKNMGTSIENRPDVANNRTEFGHWEIDLVLFKKTKNEALLLTLVERQTRYTIIRKINDKTALCVLRTLKNIFKQYRKSTFKSITSDNGSEFASLSELESKYLNIYYAHPYSSYERGTNENHNGQIREFLPKGKSINTVKKSTIRKIESCLNQKIRRKLGYRTPAELFLLRVD
ncbi:IS30 family transposase [Carnobacteriaceae bacterium zg-C25]|nr:IS30 family transposase [Carnobacteriaceae bacterium zg-C25]QTU82449.1 IS30 family transposase [Carnobacteriaceae bacterium zg-C25]QTU82546.1 IS30 family transposase [Carnobacteriaceae bacterium zg-C25]QTU82880.1 IS30 family transposase [Carnobacteriaceae bacterium zg-C25]